ncbi:hypothetical protein [[Phormidium] sp. ETS-05]|nr:hypothetical protein [[Phormidium] sp. ETS-05]
MIHVATGFNLWRLRLDIISSPNRSRVRCPSHRLPIATADATN